MRVLRCSINVPRESSFRRLSGGTTAFADSGPADCKPDLAGFGPKLVDSRLVGSGPSSSPICSNSGQLWPIPSQSWSLPGRVRPKPNRPQISPIPEIGGCWSKLPKLRGIVARTQSSSGIMRVTAIGRPQSARIRRNEGAFDRIRPVSGKFQKLHRPRSGTLLEQRNVCVPKRPADGPTSAMVRPRRGPCSHPKWPGTCVPLRRQGECPVRIGKPSPSWQAAHEQCAGKAFAESPPPPLSPSVSQSWGTARARRDLLGGPSTREPMFGSATTEGRAGPCATPCSAPPIACEGRCVAGLPEGDPSVAAMGLTSATCQHRARRPKAPLGPSFQHLLEAPRHRPRSWRALRPPMQAGAPPRRAKFPPMVLLLRSETVLLTSLVDETVSSQSASPG